MTPDYKPLIIAGQNSGAIVELNATQAEFYNNLLPLARKGNYWAALIIKELQSLSSGHVKRNVFVNTQSAGSTYTSFEMLLPGCRAKVLKCTNGKYLVWDMKLDDRYPLLQKQGQRPGLHNIRPDNGEWKSTFIQSGKLSDLPTSVVGISDGIDDVSSAADTCLDHINESNTVGSFVLERQGFDMHYTPGVKIGGLLQINQALNAASDVSLYESASLLAKTIDMARSKKHVLWVTQGGGSGVFTQALSILKSQGSDFSESKHQVYFSHPTTSFSRAQSLALDLGINLKRDNLKIETLNFNELVGGLNFGGDFIAGYQRLKQDPEYTALNYGVDALKGINRNWRAISVSAACTTALSAAMGSGGSAIAIPAILTGATAMAGLGNTLFRAWLPDTHRRLKKKL